MQKKPRGERGGREVFQFTHCRVTSKIVCTTATHVYCIYYNLLLKSCRLNSRRRVVFYYLFFFFLAEGFARATHSSTQWPAVAIQFSLSRAPPHRCVLENPKKDVLRTDTCAKTKIKHVVNGRSTVWSTIKEHGTIATNWTSSSGIVHWSLISATKSQFMNDNSVCTCARIIIL